MASTSPLINVMIQAAQKAARSLTRDFGELENLQVSRKGPSDFVSAADIKAEQTLREELQRVRPDYGMLLEEGGRVEGKDHSNTWIVDPLDGTTNFLHGFPHWCISLGVERDGDMYAGVVYDPIKDDMFYAEKGAGAFLNDRRIRVGGRQHMDEALLATDVPGVGRGNHQELLEIMGKVMGKVTGIRRTGSAALDLAYVASGKLDGYWERDVNAWDVGAGIVLVREAGGIVSDLRGERKCHHRGSIIAGNQTIHTHLMRDVRLPKQVATKTAS
ncbi:MAG: inositol monophosphatase family protein [Pseudomonadota bacterium]